MNQAIADFEDESKGAWKDVSTDQDSQPSFLVSMVAKYQNPKEADKIMKIQKNLDDIKDIMVKNIDQVLANGTQLEELMDKSEDLSATSKTFYKQAKKNNQCCKMY
eukprot:TRINITY_DN61833_c0_g1_i3.p2 TRINITY_DN61833_c0_g1~~TRINITY_DN61833_c0_g1_i3.p2  ORF type:complete len:106 (-),score=52.87 TRINITY_DN61833_c0_g1_i3:56-373(-)